jgi:hypothetical protein
VGAGAHDNGIRRISASLSRCFHQCLNTVEKLFLVRVVSHLQPNIFRSRGMECVCGADLKCARSAGQIETFHLWFNAGKRNARLMKEPSQLVAVPLMRR